MVVLGGYLETFASWNFAQPENGVTNLRAFDNRHATFALANAALIVEGRTGPVSATVAVQAGLAPNTYTLAEPALAAVGGVGDSDRLTWRNVQQGVVRWDASERWSVSAGLFLSPVGPESLAAKDDDQFSRSNLFYGLPFYHTGVTASFEAREGATVTAGVVNGWNSVVDNNVGKSPLVRVQLASDRVTAAALYLGGPERPTGAAEGPAWRHLVDAWLQLDAHERVRLLAQVDAGGERNLVGSNLWYGAAIGARVQVARPLFASARVDGLRERTTGGSAPIFWPLGDDAVAALGSLTGTLDWRPADGLSVRLEGRHDRADDPLFFDAEVGVVDGAPVADDATQTTATVALVAWF